LLLLDDIDDWKYCPKCSSILVIKFENLNKVNNFDSFDMDNKPPFNKPRFKLSE